MADKKKIKYLFFYISIHIDIGIVKNMCRCVFLHVCIYNSIYKYMCVCVCHIYSYMCACVCVSLCMTYNCYIKVTCNSNNI